MKTDKLQSQKRDVAGHGKTKEYIRTIEEIVADEGTFEFTNATEQLLIHGIICANITREHQNMPINATGHPMYEELLKHLYNTDVKDAFINILIDEDIDGTTKLYMDNLLASVVQEVVVIGKIINKES